VTRPANDTRGTIAMIVLSISPMSSNFLRT
jgi:hypothetical protein